MFTGIVEATGEVVDAREEAGGRRLRVGTGFDDLSRGQSISVSGVCLTVEEHDADAFEVFLAAETVERTYLGDLRPGDPVNVERAMPADGRFDGHVVQGHVDATTEITAIEEVGEDWRFAFALEGEWKRYLVEKGSVALDGVSLTVASRRPDVFEVAIVPETYAVTTLGEKSVGDPVHVEVDVLAKYVEALC
jgi:riboflavin synthase